jgi:hypothetical protein
MFCYSLSDKLLDYVIVWLIRPVFAFIRVPNDEFCRGFFSLPYRRFFPVL